MSDGTLTVTPILTFKPTSTLALLRQRTTIPYVGGTSETIALTQQPYNIGVARKPITTLRRLLTNRDLTKPRRRRQRERQKKNSRFNEQNNNSARARFFVHSFAFTAQLRREMTKF